MSRCLNANNANNHHIYLHYTSPLHNSTLQPFTPLPQILPHNPPKHPLRFSSLSNPIPNTLAPFSAPSPTACNSFSLSCSISFARLTRSLIFARASTFASPASACHFGSDVRDGGDRGGGCAWWMGEGGDLLWWGLGGWLRLRLRLRCATVRDAGAGSNVRVGGFGIEFRAA